MILLRLDLIRRQYEAAGWRHLVAAHGKGDPFNAGQTDLWINFAHMDVTGMMVLISAPKDLNLIALNGDISTRRSAASSRSFRHPALFR